MTAVTLLTQFVGMNLETLSKEEMSMVEASLFIHVLDVLDQYFRDRYASYFRPLEDNSNMEETVLDSNFIRYLINDILATEEYTVSGIAYYANAPEDLIYDLVIGSNSNPTLCLSRKIIDLHRTVRPSLYRNILKKINFTNHSE